MPAPFFDVYALAPGWNIALGSLTNAESVFGYAPASQPPNLFPNAKAALSGKVKGGGRIDHAWGFPDVLPMTWLTNYINTYFSGGTVKSAQMTIYTRRHDVATMVRYNVWAVKPEAGIHYEYDGMNFPPAAVGLIVPFNNLQPSS